MTAQDLLKHKFIKGAKKTETLKELVDRKKVWDKQNGKVSNSNSEEEEKDDGGTRSLTLRSILSHSLAQNAPQWEFEDDDEQPTKKPESKPDSSKPQEKEPAKKRSDRTKGERSDKRSHRKEGEGRSGDRKRREKVHADLLHPYIDSVSSSSALNERRSHLTLPRRKRCAILFTLQLRKFRSLSPMKKF